MAKKLNANNFEKTVKKIYKTQKITVADVSGEEYDLVIETEAKPTKINEMVNDASNTILGLAREYASGQTQIDVTDELMNAYISVMFNFAFLKHMTNIEGLDVEFETSEEAFNFFVQTLKQLDDLCLFDKIMDNFSEEVKEKTMEVFYKDLGDILQSKLNIIKETMNK